MYIQYIFKYVCKCKYLKYSDLNFFTHLHSLEIYYLQKIKIES